MHQLPWRHAESTLKTLKHHAAAVRELYLSPGHNYFGHHGGAAGTHDNIAVERIECIAHRGIRGDRFFDYKADYKGQITFFASEVLAAMTAALGLERADPAATRRNVITTGLDLTALIGARFELQGITFEGVEECRPCYWMNGAFRDERAEAWLRGRGGLRARILSDGVLTRG